MFKSSISRFQRRLETLAIHPKQLFPLAPVHLRSFAAQILAPKLLLTVCDAASRIPSPISFFFSSRFSSAILSNRSSTFLCPLSSCQFSPKTTLSPCPPLSLLAPPFRPSSSSSFHLGVYLSLLLPWNHHFYLHHLLTAEGPEGYYIVQVVCTISCTIRIEHNLGCRWNLCEFPLRSLQWHDLLPTIIVNEPSKFTLRSVVFLKSNWKMKT